MEREAGNAGKKANVGLDGKVYAFIDAPSDESSASVQKGALLSLQHAHAKSYFNLRSPTAAKVKARRIRTKAKRSQRRTLLKDISKAVGCVDCDSEIGQREGQKNKEGQHCRRLQQSWS